MTHPSRGDLEALANNALSSEQAEQLQSHVASCSECSVQLFELTTLGGGGKDSKTQVSGAAPLQQPRLERGATLGRYVVLDVIGSGGMGVVYAAWDPELDRKVAIKLLQAAPGADTSDGQGWLLREAQALAKLSHPNVIAVHDVGSLPAAGIFVAMELVDGQTLREWAKAPRTAREIVEVFRAAGQGLDAAHRAGLIHRDFKPDNVLVGTDGRVRVMDFGLARAAGSALQSAPIATLRESALSQELTRAGTLMGTPAYMAPELYSGAAADARTDQFAFGVSLFEALYGARPFRKAYAERPPESRWKIEEPQAGRRVPSWLRAICERALAEKREQRFASMGELLEALGKDPAVARRRYALAASALVAVALLLAGVRALSVRQDKLCTGAEQKLAGVWDAPTRGQVQAAFRATGSPLADDLFTRASGRIDAYAHDWTAMRTEACEATRVRGEQTEEVLGLRMECLDQRLMELRSLEQLLAHADAKVATKAVQAAYNLTDLAQCADGAALRARVPPPNPDVRAKVADLRRELAAAKALYDTGQGAEADKRARAALAEAETLHYKPIAAEAHYRVGTIGDGKTPDALDAYATAMWDAEAGRDDELFAEAAARWVHLAANLRKTDQAQSWLPLADAAITRVGNPVRARLQYLAGDANILAYSHHPAEGVKAAKDGVALAEQSLPANDPAIASAWNVYGKACEDNGDFEGAQAAYARALKIREQVLGPKHPDTGIAYMNLSAADEDQGRFTEALEHAQHAMEIFSASLGQDSVLFAVAQGNAAEALQGVGRFAEARAGFDRALAITLAPLGMQNPMRCDMMDRRSETDLELHDLARFKKDVDDDAACRNSPPPSDPDGARLSSYRAAESVEAQPAVAAASLQSAVPVLSTQHGRPATFDLALAQFTLARALAATRQLPKARELAAEAQKNFVASKRPFWPDEVGRWLAQHD